MIDVRVCPSCLTKRRNGYSRVSDKIWKACLAYLQDAGSVNVIDEDGVIEVYSDAVPRNLLMANEDGAWVDDALLGEVIVSQFRSYRI